MSQYTITNDNRSLGTLVSVASSPLVEAVSRAGPDWLFFDLEHSTLSLADVQAMLPAVPVECATFLRVEEAQPVYVKRALDTGCTGVIVPQVNTPELARAMVQAAKYPPFGGRSVGLGRALGYGARLAEGVKIDNDRTLLIVQIEHADAVANVEAIAATPGVDGLFVGPYDLSGSLGHPGDVQHPDVQAAIARILAAAREAEKLAGIFVGDPQGARDAFERGFQLVAVGADISRLVAATRAMCETVRAA